MVEAVDLPELLAAEGLLECAAAFSCGTRQLDPHISAFLCRFIARRIRMYESAASPGLPLGQKPLLRLFHCGEAAARRQRVLDPNRSLVHRVLPALGLAHEIPELPVDGVFAQGELEKLLPPGVSLRILDSVECLDDFWFHPNLAGAAAEQ